MSGPSPQTQPAESAGCLSILVRMTWLVLGNVALLFLLVPIVGSRGFSYLDVIFWAVVAFMLAIRFVDIRFLKGQDTEGKRATMADWRRYSLLVMAIAGGIWAVVHVVLLLIH